MRIDETRRKAYGVPDLLLYASLIDDGVMLLQNGALMAAWSFRGPDLSSSTFEEMEGISRQLNSLLKLGSDWMIHCDAIRSFAPGYPGEGAFPDSVTRLIDAERRAQFMQEGTHLRSDYFISLSYLPPLQKEEKMKGYVFSSPDGKTTGVAEQVLKFYSEKILAFDVMLKTILKANRLGRVAEKDEFGNECYFDDFLRYVRRCVQGEDYKFALPEIPVYLHDTIGAIELVGGVKPRLGRRYMGVVAIDGFPSYSSPGHLAVLDALPFEYRWSTRAILHDPEQAKPILEGRYKKWKGMERGFLDQFLGKVNGRVNQHAARMATDGATALSVAAAGDVLFGMYTSNIVLLNEDREKLDQNLSDVVKALKNAGFGARIEDLNALEAWRGTLPGDANSNPRRFYVHTLNIADSLPISAIWAGEKENPSALMPKHSPPLLMASSTGATPFGLNLHVQDLGHTLVMGPSGSGKSTLLALMVAQWFRFPKARVVCFDKGQSMYVLNQGAGGQFYDLGGETDAINFCPLADLQTGAERAWAADYIETLASMNGLVINPEIRNAINQAIQVMSKEKESRSLTDFVATVQHNGVRDALKDFTTGGPNGGLLDARLDSMRDSRFLIFEMDTIMGAGDGNSRALIAVLLYLFHVVEKRLDGSPTLIVLDEAWVYLKHAQFRNKIREWLKVMRKMNCAVIMATQSLSDVMNSDVSDVVIESCPTKILLANTEAQNEGSRQLYENLGLNPREIANIAKMIPKMHYFVTSPVGKRTISLGIGGVAMSFVGVSSVELRKKAQAFKREYSDSWVGEWLRWRGTTTGNKALAGWAEFYEKEQSKEKGVIQ